MDRLIKQFDFDHLPLFLQEVSEPFYDLAHKLRIMGDLDVSDLEVSLRKLLEAKDAAVRARLL